MGQQARQCHTPAAWLLRFYVETAAKESFREELKQKDELALWVFVGIFFHVGEEAGEKAGRCLFGSVTSE